VQEGVCDGELSCSRSTAAGLERCKYNAYEGVGRIRNFLCLLENIALFEEKFSLGNAYIEYPDEYGIA